jgi:hypothetical protein
LRFYEQPEEDYCSKAIKATIRASAAVPKEKKPAQWEPTDEQIALVLKIGQRLQG